MLGRDAEVMRGNDLIEGIVDEGGKMHKISLFADDVLLFIRNPHGGGTMGRFEGTRLMRGNQKQ